MIDHDIPINVIILTSIENEMESMIDASIEILGSCKSRAEKEALIRMVANDSRRITLREILTKDIQGKAQILDETKEY